MMVSSPAIGLALSVAAHGHVGSTSGGGWPSILFALLIWGVAIVVSCIAWKCWEEVQKERRQRERREREEEYAKELQELYDRLKKIGYW